MKIHNKAFKSIGPETKRMIVITLTIFVVMVLLRPTLFLRPANFLSMGYQLPALGLYSLAMMFVMLSGGIDLSIVAIGNLCCVVAAFILKVAERGQYTGSALVFQFVLAVAVAMAIGLGIGALNGMLINRLKIAPMLLTMATASIITGINIVLTEGKSISGIPEQVLYFGNHTLGGIPYSMWLLITVLIFSGFMLNRNKFGFKLKMLGSNPLASSYSGINNRTVLIKTYMISGFFSALCGLEILLKTNSAKADYASTYVLQAILCAVLGATNPNGGFAKISCLVLSLISLQFLSSGFNLLRLGGYYKDFSWGALLLLVLSFDYLSSIMQKYINRINLQRRNL